jgi:hypothetical protein
MDTVAATGFSILNASPIVAVIRALAINGKFAFHGGSGNYAS